MRKRILLYILFTAALLLSGCMPRVPTPTLPQEQNTTRPALWQDTSTLEDHYSLKPEPYSLESGQKDPELLGPQSTIKRSVVNEGIMAEQPATAPSAPSEETERFLPRDETPEPQGGMTRRRCIDLIGKAKYDEYTRRFGSENAALRRCVILQRVQK